MHAHWLLLIFSVFWMAAAVRPVDRVVWAMENSFTVATVVTLAIIYPYFRFTDLSYTLLFVFLCLHTLGAYYTYAKVPYDKWFKRLFGRTLSSMLHLRRNHYDRLVHFAFGLLLVVPAREILPLRHGWWSYALPVSVIMSLSLLFEIAEWALAATFGGGAGQDYLAAQGDSWDAHKDMALASLGAVISMALAAAIS